MKTLILNGSPHKNGDTAALINKLTEGLSGDIKIVNCYSANLSPCVDCRICREKSSCAIDDEMKDIYRYIEVCDNAVIASPIYFSELTGKLLDIASRFQLYYSAKYVRREPIPVKRKRGAVILTGGGTGNPLKAYDTAKFILKQINAAEIFPCVCSHNTDKIPAALDEDCISRIRETAEFLSESRRS